MAESLGEACSDGEASIATVVDALDMLDRMGMADSAILRRVASGHRTRSFFKTRRPRPNACQADIVYSGPRLCRAPL